MHQVLGQVVTRLTYNKQQIIYVLTNCSFERLQTGLNPPREREIRQADIHLEVGSSVECLWFRSLPSEICRFLKSTVHCLSPTASNAVGLRLNWNCLARAVMGQEVAWGAGVFVFVRVSLGLHFYEQQLQRLVGVRNESGVKAWGVLWSERENEIASFVFNV